jgi:hypothetical protein
MPARCQACSAASTTLARPRKSYSKRLVSVHAAFEIPDTNVEALADELERLKAKFEQQSILLQELQLLLMSMSKEPAKTVQ